MKRHCILGYALLCYAISILVMLYSIAFFGNFYVPRTIDSVPVMPTGRALFTNLALVALFGIQHSGMARPAFKRMMRRVLPEVLARSTYVLMSCLAVGAVIGFWQPMGGVLWQVEEMWLSYTIIAIYLGGWAFMLWSTCLIDHFGMFGLRQAWQWYRGRTYIEPRFMTPSAYRVVRHPVYAGWLLVLWASPVMTFTHFVLAAGLTTYLLIGIQFEERDLVRRHPFYKQYRRKVPMLIPSIRKRLVSGLVPHTK